jgi:chaperonin GroES
MKAVGNNILVEKIKEGPVSKTTGGLLLTESQRQDIRYKQAKVVNCGDLVSVIKEGDIIFYDKHAGHKIEIEDATYDVIRLQDIVIVL